MYMIRPPQVTLQEPHGPQSVQAGLSSVTSPEIEQVRLWIHWLYVKKRINACKEKEIREVTIDDSWRTLDNDIMYPFSTMEPPAKKVKRIFNCLCHIVSHIVNTKHPKNCESCPSQVTWKAKFKCQICLSCLSSLLSIPCVMIVLVVLSLSCIMVVLVLLPVLMTMMTMTAMRTVTTMMSCLS